MNKVEFPKKVIDEIKQTWEFLGSQEYYTAIRDVEIFKSKTLQKARENYDIRINQTIPSDTSK